MIIWFFKWAFKGKIVITGSKVLIWYIEGWSIGNPTSSNASLRFLYSIFNRLFSGLVHLSSGEKRKDEKENVQRYEWLKDHHHLLFLLVMQFDSDVVLIASQLQSVVILMGVLSKYVKKTHLIVFALVVSRIDNWSSPGFSKRAISTAACLTKPKLPQYNIHVLASA